MKQARGRTAKALLSPGKIQAFREVTSYKQFEKLWEKNPMWIFASLSHASYYDEQKFRQTLEPLGATVRYYESRMDERGFTMGRQAYLVSWPNKYFLVFRGTDVKEKIGFKVPNQLAEFLRSTGLKIPDQIMIPFAPDIIDDIKVSKEKYRKAKVHKGMLEAYLELHEQIKDDIEKLNISDNLYATGHSLGAALATLAAMDYPLKMLVTFGSPRIGLNIDKEIPEELKYYRFVNGDDPCPRVPPENFPFKYEHYGKRTYIVDKKHGGPDFRFDHSIVNYAAILNDKYGK